MRSTWMAAAALVVLGLVGCGGDDGPELRTYLACGNAQACGVMQSDVPVEMYCSAPEVPSCPTEGVLGTCWVDYHLFVMTTYVYDADVLYQAERECLADGGVWMPATP